MSGSLGDAGAPRGGFTDVSEGCKELELPKSEPGKTNLETRPGGTPSCHSAPSKYIHLAVRGFISHKVPLPSCTAIWPTSSSYWARLIGSPRWTRAWISRNLISASSKLMREELEGLETGLDRTNRGMSGVTAGRLALFHFCPSCMYHSPVCTPICHHRFCASCIRSLPTSASKVESLSLPESCWAFRSL